MSRYPQAKILFVDDEQNVLSALERAFIDDDYEIYTVNSGEKGLSVIEKHGPFQVIVSDYRMPFMNGDVFLQEIYERWPETERVVLSGYVDIAAIVSAINKGHIYRFIPKPWNSDDLRRTIHDCLDRYYLHKKDLKIHAELELAQEILSNLPAGVVAINPEQMVIYCNENAVQQLPDSLPANAASTTPFLANSTLQGWAAEVDAGTSLSTEIVTGGKKFILRGKTARIAQNKIVIIALQEAK